MSGGHFGSTFQTYDLQPQAKCKNQMYVSMKRMSKVGEKHCTSQTTLFSVCGWCQFILSPCSGWPSQHIQKLCLSGIKHMCQVEIPPFPKDDLAHSAISEGCRVVRRASGQGRWHLSPRMSGAQIGRQICSLSDSVSTESSVSEPESLEESVSIGASVTSWWLPTKSLGKS